MTVENIADGVFWFFVIMGVLFVLAMAFYKGYYNGY